MGLEIGTEQRMIEIGSRKIGEGLPTFVIAEVGSNHNGDFDLARQLIDEASTAGVDAVKFQTFRARELYSKYTPGFSYLEDKNTYDLIQSLEIDRSWHAPLKEYCEQAGLVFLSSPFDANAVDELTELKVEAFKIASFELPDTVLISRAAKSGFPMILSTGMASWADIQAGVSACRDQNNLQVVLLQCTSLYPAPASLSNLRAMKTMKAAFGTEIGYSDHTEGDHVALAAVAAGASVIEKHFTLDRGLAGPDHSFAIEPDELKEMMKRIRDVEAAFGDGYKEGPRPEEREMYDKGRRSLHARIPIARGQTITAEMLTVKRPGLGLLPTSRDFVIGRVAKVDIEEDQWLTWEMI